MDLPAALDPVLSARLREVLRSAMSGDGAGTCTLNAALDDPAVHTVVLAVKLGAEPGASLVEVMRSSDTMAQWMKLSCI